LAGNTRLSSHRDHVGSIGFGVDQDRVNDCGQLCQVTYCASSVDNRFLGNGNKVLHTVVGQFGVLEGNAVDLRSGLPFSVVIEAMREAITMVIQKHDGNRQFAGVPLRCWWFLGRVHNVITLLA